MITMEFNYQWATITFSIKLDKFTLIYYGALVVPMLLLLFVHYYGAIL